MTVDRRIIAALACVLAGWLWVGGAALADVGLQWSLDRDEIALGEPVTLTLERLPDAAGPGIDAFDRGVLVRDFEVYSRVLGRRSGRETLTLELYPLRSGDLRLPLPGAEVRPPLRVRDQGPGSFRVSFRLFAEPEAWRARQPVRLVLEACTRGMVLWQTPDPGFLTGLEIQPLGRAVQVGRDEERDCVPYQWSWSLTPTTGGRFRIEFGMLEGTRFGQRLRFPLPLLLADVAGAPDWLPAGLAQVEPRLELAAIPARSPVGEVLNLSLLLEADYSESVLAALLGAQFAGDPTWSRYPPDLLPLRVEGVIPRWEIRLHAQPETAGELGIPSLRLPWFDADADVLKEVVFEGPSIVVEARPRGLGWQVAGGVLVAVLLAAAVRVLCREWAWRAERRALTRRIRESEGFDALHQALIATPPWPEVRGSRSARAVPLGRWSLDFIEHWHAPALKRLVARLDAARFAGAAEEDLAVLREELLRCLRRATPRRGWG
jgi:hypothetical protein